MNPFQATLQGTMRSDISPSKKEHLQKCQLGWDILVPRRVFFPLTGEVYFLFEVKVMLVRSVVCLGDRRIGEFSSENLMPRHGITGPWCQYTSNGAGRFTPLRFNMETGNPQNYHSSKDFPFPNPSFWVFYVRFPRGPYHTRS